MSARRIFICYRHEDSAGYAGRIYDRLNQRFPDRVFRDADKIPLLNRWGTVVEDTLRSCAVAVVLIGTRWLDRGADGTRRIDQADDPVRKEIEALLRLDIEVIPVLIAGAAVPSRDALPEAVAPITEWQALRIDDDDFDHDTGRLIQALENRLRALDALAGGDSPAESTASSSSSAPETRQEVLERYKGNWDDAGPFLMAIEDVFDIAGRGPVATGEVKRGQLRVGDAVELVGIRPTRAVAVTGLEMFRKLVDQVNAGDKCGVLLRGVKKGDVERGQVLAWPSSLQSGNTLTLKAYLLSAADGGLSRPLASGDRLDFFIHTVSVTGTIVVQGGADKLHPGHEGTLVVTLSMPMALARGLLIALRQDDSTIGFGSIL